MAARHHAWYLICRSPANLSQDEVRHFLQHLINECKLPWFCANQAVSTLTFLFHFTLKQSKASFIFPYRKVPTRLPEVLSPAEVGRIIDAACHLYKPGRRHEKTSWLHQETLVIHMALGWARGKFGLMPGWVTNSPQTTC